MSRSTFNKALMLPACRTLQMGGETNMDTERTAKKLYKDKNNDVTISCQHCGNSKTISVTKFKKLFTPIKVKCICQASFYISIESREYYRKAVNLHGTYLHHRSKNFDYIYIENLSLSGIGFKTNMNSNLQIDDIIEIRFTLDNNKQTDICKTGIVKRVSNREVGAEFCNMSTYSAELGFYLMPN
jgi:hypothetical protein